MGVIWEAIINFVINILSAILPKLFSKRELSEFSKKYEKLRYDTALALTMYARNYHNPVDLAKTRDNTLPQDYINASNELRKIASEAKALAAIMNEKRPPIKKSDLEDVSSYLIGLSNSMTTPYNCSTLSEVMRDEKNAVREWEARIKKLLNID